jgi:3-isopropylmalate/(R)-2-methylmalate dehydratase large subunit
MTITEKILAKHCGKDMVKPGELVNVDIDLIFCHEVTTPPAISMLQEKGIKKVFDSNKIVVTPDHFVPNKDIKSAELAKRLREWTKEQGIKNYFEVGCHGVCHAIIPEKGFALPGTTMICGDSHTCTHGALGAFAVGVGTTDLAYALAVGKLWFRVPPSLKFIINGQLPKGVYAKDVILRIIKEIGVSGALYKAMEFTGSVIDELSVESRMTICNMAIEAGGKSGIINPDQKTIDYVQARIVANNNANNRKYEVITSDEDADYEKIYEYDVGGWEPMVAYPHSPSNGKNISEAEKDNIKIDQAYLGSCTNGRIEDLRIAAEIIKGKKIKDGVRMIVVPATTDIWKQANKEGLLDIFMEAGATVSTPTCGACLGGYMGILASGERCISSTNRNFVGRMGSPTSEVYLASPATVAASAIKGIISDPRT